MTWRRPFVALTSASLLSSAGTRLSTIAIPWLVLTQTQSPLWTGIVGMAEMLPYVLVKALSGPLIDRLQPKRIATRCDWLSAVVLALIPALHLADSLTIPMLLPIVFVLGALRGPADAAKQAMVPDIAAIGAFPIERVTGTITAVERLASTLGAATSGLLIASLGPALSLAANGAALAIAAAIVQFGIPASTSARRVVAGFLAYGNELLDGWRFLHADKVLVAITIMVGLANLLDQGFGAVFLPTWIKTSGHGPQVLGILLATFSGCSIVGATIAALTGERLPRLPVYIIAFLLAGFPRFYLVAATAILPMLITTFAIAGFASGFLNPILSAVIFEHIPKHLLGRVTALTSALIWALLPFGGLVGAAAITLLGLRGGLFAAGTLYLAISMLPFTGKGFRDFKRISSDDLEPNKLSE
ncbi:MFS transporter [Oryzifoliimicrobium ureilyticus]|uniref:MFS transporter n=1 Tax=Oryzifoliimicrobium ureilyticus TaxID=3113724 RepID=UPI003076677E